MEAYIATMGPSATLMRRASSSSKPSHFFDFFLGPFPELEALSPLNPSQSRPSAVPAAKTPVFDIAIDIIKGGERLSPPSTTYGSGHNISICAGKKIKELSIDPSDDETGLFLEHNRNEGVSYHIHRLQVL